MTNLIGEGAVVVLLDETNEQVTGTSWKPRSINRAFQITSTGTANVVVEVSNDDTNWLTMSTYNFGGAQTDGFTSVASWKYVRARLTAVPSANVKVTMGT